jgi:hypothetical protein
VTSVPPSNGPRPAYPSAAGAPCCSGHTLTHVKANFVASFSLYSLKGFIKQGAFTSFHLIGFTRVYEGLHKPGTLTLWGD